MLRPTVYGLSVVMKNKLFIAVIVLSLIGTLGYTIPCIFAMSKARPLYGNFDMGLQCMGGHEIFLFLDETLAYKNCPGHREMDPMGPIVRGKESLTIFRSDGKTPWLRIDYEGSRHKVTSSEIGWPNELPQVANPWRTWLPKLLPEH
jgi:hypothetical protein